MIEIRENRREILGPLFESYCWNYLAEAILDDLVVSRAVTDNLETPKIGVLELARIRLFVVGGDAGHPASRKFIEDLLPWSAVVSASPGWDALVEVVHGERIETLKRWAFTSGSLNPDRLRDLRDKIPPDFRLVLMDLGLTRQLAAEESRFSGDHLLNYQSPEDFMERGFGFCILEGERIVSVASTFVACRRGIEIQINTRESHRGKGLGTAAAAAILLHSLEQGLDPGWDAANDISASLAEKLGYTFQGNYKMYFLPGEE